MKVIQQLVLPYKPWFITESLQLIHSPLLSWCKGAVAQRNPNHGLIQPMFTSAGSHCWQEACCSHHAHTVVSAT